MCINAKVYIAIILFYIYNFRVTICCVPAEYGTYKKEVRKECNYEVLNEEYVMLFQHFIVSTSWFCFRMFMMRFSFYRYVECQKCYLAVPETRLAAHQKSKDCRRCKQHGLLRCPLCFLTVEPGDKGWREHILKQPGCLQNPRPLIHASWTCATLNPKP